MLNVQYEGKKSGVEIIETREEVGVPRRDSELFASTRCRVMVVADFALVSKNFMPLCPLVAGRGAWTQTPCVQLLRDAQCARRMEKIRRENS